MTDKEKILHLLESKNLTAAQFADTIGIPRSSISHILSERNRLSMDIARKVVKQYPEITYEWLCDDSPEQRNISKTPASFITEFPAAAKLPESAKRNAFVGKPDLAHSRVDDNHAFDAKHVVKMIVFYSDQTWQEIM